LERKYKVSPEATGRADSSGLANDAVRAGRLLNPADVLQRGALGFPTVLMQSVAQIAPAVGVIGAVAFNTQLAGIAAPSTFAGAFLIALVVAMTVGQLAKYLPSAGGLSTYVHASVNPTAGFLVGWTYSFLTASASGAAASYAGSVMQSQLKTAYGVNSPWQIWTFGVLAFAGYACFRGIKISGRALIVLTVAEILILLMLAVSGFLWPGPVGVNATGLNPMNATSANGFYLAVVFSIFAFTGWEGAAAIAEEARRPRWAIPRAMTWSVIVLGLFFVFCAWGLQIGWGTANLEAFANSADSPPMVVAQRLWHGAWVVVLLCLLNSCIGVSIATVTDSSRMWYSMARSGALPRYLNYIHPKYHTPTRATAALMVWSCLVAFGGGVWIGGVDLFYFFGFAATLVYVFVYASACIGVVKLFTSTHRGKFNWLLHAVLPGLAILVLLWVAYKSVDPLPIGPNKYAPVADAVLLVSGVIALACLVRRQGGRAWKTHASQIFIEEPGE
jgi:amino acid transporter